MLLLEASETVTISQGALVSIVISVLGFIGILVTILHKDMTGKIADSKQSAKDGINALHSDLKPLTITVALHDDKIKELKEEQKALADRFNGHDGRINKLEHDIDKLHP